jgi:hypothetical protein
MRGASFELLTRSGGALNATLAQLVCLTTYGRRWLADPFAEWPPDLHLDNSTFRYVSQVQFSGGGFWRDVPSWLEGLRDRGAKALWLYVEQGPVPGASLPLPDSVAFVNGEGGTWGVLVRTESGQELWRAVWNLVDPDAPNQRIWSVEYVGIGSNVAAPVPPLDGAEAALRAALDESEMTARELEQPFWAEWFAEARRADGSFRFHPDMVPADFAAERRRVAAMAEQAWPFGGMGSWNEVIGGGHPVALRLYTAILLALAAAANA